MKIKQGFELRTICGEAIIVAHGIENIDFSKIISLNESAAYLWRNVVDKDFDANTLAHLLTEEYDVDEATALADAQKVIQDWSNAGLAE
jgi:hypothetical protein